MCCGLNSFAWLENALRAAELYGIAGSQWGLQGIKRVERRMQGPNPEKAMQLEKMRIVMDRSGIKRLEPCGDDALLAKTKRLPAPFAHRGHRR